MKVDASVNQATFGLKLRIYLLVFAFILSGFITVGLLTYMTDFSNKTLGFSLSYFAGLSMIFLPSTLPLVFIMSPIAVTESPRKSIMMTLFFGGGMLITLTIYEVALVYVGGTMELLTATLIPVIVGGGWVYFLGLSELGLITMNIPGLESHTTQKHGDYLKAFLIGFSLANITFWYQNPIFNSLHINLKDTADIFTGGFVVLAYDIGKVTSIIFLTILGIIGINAAPGIKKVNGSVTKALDWVLVFVAAFLLTLGGLFRRWYNANPVYEYWNNMLITSSGGRIGEVEIFSTRANAMLEAVPQWLGPYIFLLLLAIPIILHFYKNSQRYLRFGAKAAYHFLLIQRNARFEIRARYAIAKAAKRFQQSVVEVYLWSR